MTESQELGWTLSFNRRKKTLRYEVRTNNRSSFHSTKIRKKNFDIHQPRKNLIFQDMLFAMSTFVALHTTILPRSAN